MAGFRCFSNMTHRCACSISGRSMRTRGRCCQEGGCPDEASSSCIIHVLLLPAATDVFHMWGFFRRQQRAEDSRLRIFITSDFNKLESALERAPVTSDLGIRKLPHKWPCSASVNKSLLFLQINASARLESSPAPF